MNNFFMEIASKYFIDKTVLLIGIGDVSNSYLEFPDMFISNGAKSCEYLEIFEPYIRTKSIVGEKPYKITVGDVRNIKSIFTENSFDVIVWSHGPEHVTFEEFGTVFNDMCYIAKDLIFLAMPYGSHWDKSCDRPKNGNEHERHKQKNILEDTFDSYGFNFNKKILGEINTIEGQICLWKELIE